MPNYKPLSQLVADWRITKADMERYIKKLPDTAGAVAVEVCKDNFRLQAYDDGTSRARWAKREKRTNRRYDRRKGVKGTVFNSANKILEQSGNLRDSIKYKKLGPNLVWIGVDLSVIPYAKIHNEGLKGLAWGKNSFVMPKRQYMPMTGEGPNKKILTAIQKKVTFDLKRIMQKFKR